MRFAILGALVVACGGRDAPPAAPPAHGVELQVPGVSPRLLRYAPVAGTRATQTLALDASITAGGRDVRMPTLALTLATEVIAVRPDGSAELKTTILAAEPRAVAGAMPAGVAAPPVEALVGTVFVHALSPTGERSAAKVTPARALPPAVQARVPQIEQSLARLAAPLPEQPVGIGAQWTVRQELATAGARLASVTTYAIAGIEGDRVRLASTTALSGPSQTVELDGAKAELRELAGSGASRLTIDLARLTLDGTIHLELRGHVTAGGLAAPMRMATTVAVTSRGP